MFMVPLQRNEQNKTKSFHQLALRQREKERKENGAQGGRRASALINTCRGNSVSGRKCPPPHSHAAVLVPQGLSVLWAQRRLRTGHVIGVNALGALILGGGAGQGLARRGLVLLAGLTADGGSTDVAD